MTTQIAPGATIGIVGGGQLGRMLAIAAAQLGYRTHVFAPERDAVAISVAHTHTTAAYDDIMALNGFAQSVDIITIEFENVPVETLRHLAEHRPVAPDPSALAVAQDRLSEKEFAASAGLNVGPYSPVQSAVQLADAVARLGTPAILKTVREGYDGKGQVPINGPEDAASAWARLGSGRAVLEQRIDFLGETSVIIVRRADGTKLVWDCPDNRHDSGILRHSRVPAPAEWASALSFAREQSAGLADALNYVGVLACEFFVTADGPLFNEFAPRVHNSGHWTIEGAVTSQFENHIRAICGLPLGDVSLTGTGARMDNLIGDDVDRWLEYLADPQCHLHLYDKGHGKAGRKMGHATWVDVA